MRCGTWGRDTPSASSSSSPSRPAARLRGSCGNAGTPSWPPSWPLQWRRSSRSSRSSRSWPGRWRCASRPGPLAISPHASSGGWWSWNSPRCRSRAPTARLRNCRRLVAEGHDGAEPNRGNQREQQGIGDHAHASLTKRLVTALREVMCFRMQGLSAGESPTRWVVRTSQSGPPAPLRSEGVLVAGLLEHPLGLAQFCPGDAAGQPYGDVDSQTDGLGQTAA